MDARHRKHREVCKQRLTSHAQVNSSKLLKNPFQTMIDQNEGLYLPMSGMNAHESAALQRFFEQVDTEPVVMALCFFANGEAEPMSFPANER